MCPAPSSTEFPGGRSLPSPPGAGAWSCCHRDACKHALGKPPPAASLTVCSEERVRAGQGRPPQAASSQMVTCQRADQGLVRRGSLWESACAHHMAVSMEICCKNSSLKGETDKHGTGTVASLREMPESTHRQRGVRYFTEKCLIRKPTFMAAC